MCPVRRHSKSQSPGTALTPTGAILMCNTASTAAPGTPGSQPPSRPTPPSLPPRTKASPSAFGPPDYAGTPGGNVSGWVTAGPVVVAGVTKYYHLGHAKATAGSRVAMRQGAEVHYLHGDHLGSTSLTTNSAGAVVAEGRYLPFGGSRWSNGSAMTDFGFTGQREESSLGLYDYNARMYSASLGRFISADSIVPDGSNPQSLNRYAYTLNNPLKYIDPTGNVYECSGGVGVCGDIENHRDAILRRASILRDASTDGTISDLEAAARLTEYAAAFRDGDFVNDVGMIFTGLTGEYPGWDFLRNNRDPRYQLFLDGGVIGQEGFDPVFQDPVTVQNGNNQSRHFWFYVQLSYYGEALGSGYATLINGAHETFLFPPNRASGASYQDYAVGQVGVELGQKLYSGELAPNQVGDYMRENLSVNSQTAQQWRINANSHFARNRSIIDLSMKGFILYSPLHYFIP